MADLMDIDDAATLLEAIAKNVSQGNYQSPPTVTQEQHICPVCKGTATHPAHGKHCDHFDTYSTFQSYANRAFSGAFPAKRENMHQPRNSRAAVLIVNWWDDKLGIFDELADLRDVFERQYRFQTETWTIPKSRSSAKLTERIHKFIERHCDEDQNAGDPLPLLLVVYAGQAEPPSRERICKWTCRGSSVNWSTIQQFLFDAPADVLILLDCCYAAAATRATVTSENGTKEILAASGSQALTPGGQAHSFTRDLTDELRVKAHHYRWRNTIPTVAALHASMTSNGKSTHREPLYVATRSEQFNSITLEPLPEPSQITRAKRPRSPSPPTDGLQLDNPKPTRALLAIQSARSPGKDLVRFLREEGILPHYVAGMEVISVEAIYESNSTLSLVTVPVAVWHLMPDHPACRYIGLVHTKNLVEDREVQSLFYEANYRGTGGILRTRHSSQSYTPIIIKTDHRPQTDPRAVADHRPQFSLRPPSDHKPLLAPKPSATPTMDTPRASEPAASTRQSPAVPISSELQHVHATPTEHSINQGDLQSLPPPDQKNGIHHELDRIDTRSTSETRQAQPMEETVESPTKRIRLSRPSVRARALIPTKERPNDTASEKKRRYICAFQYYGCPGTFTSKNEWKRHVASQHLQLGFYRCDIGSCKPDSSTDDDASDLFNDFNRKDLFTQHLRRMHRPWSPSTKTPTTEMKEEFEASLEAIRQRCWREKRQPPQKSKCGFCGRAFEGERSWEERMEHTARHYETDDQDQLRSPDGKLLEQEDEDLTEWGLNEGVVEPGRDAGVFVLTTSGAGTVGTAPKKGGKRGKQEEESDEIGGGDEGEE